MMTLWINKAEKMARQLGSKHANVPGFNEGVVEKC